MTQDEALNNIAIYSSMHNGVLDESVKVIAESIKALEIIKNKNVIVHFILIWDREKYNGHLMDNKMKLSKKEYDLLKETLQ